MRYSRLHRCRLVSPALSISLFAALAAFPACAQGGVATHDEMERAKAALAEALKREQAGGGDQGPGRRTLPPPRRRRPQPLLPPGRKRPSPRPKSPPAKDTVPMTIAPPPPPKYPTAARSLAAKSKGACAGQNEGRGKQACCSPNAFDPRKEVPQNCECAQGDG